MEHQWNLVLKIIKLKESTAELGHSDLLSVCKSSFAQMPISQENMNVFFVRFDHNCPGMELFQILQMGYPRWPPGAITKNSINLKTTISHEPLVEIDPRRFLV